MSGEPGVAAVGLEWPGMELEDPPVPETEAEKKPPTRFRRLNWHRLAADCSR
jgi:hypothetical protein